MTQDAESVCPDCGVPVATGSHATKCFESSDDCWEFIRGGVKPVTEGNALRLRAILLIAEDLSPAARIRLEEWLQANPGELIDGSSDG